jgi:hypothetical protein
METHGVIDNGDGIHNLLLSTRSRRYLERE